MMRSRRHAAVSLALGITLLAGGPLAAQIPSDVGQVWKTYDLQPFVTAAGPDS